MSDDEAHAVGVTPTADLRREKTIFWRGLLSLLVVLLLAYARQRWWL